MNTYQTGIPSKTTKMQNWNFSPSAISQNLSRMASGGYGGRYGLMPSSGLYENRMADIQGKFASQQAQADEAARQKELADANSFKSRTLAQNQNQFDQTFGLQQRQFEESIKQWADQFGLNQEQLSATIKNLDLTGLISMLDLLASQGQLDTQTAANFMAQLEKLIGGGTY